MKPRLFSDALLAELAATYGTPLYVYDAATIEARARELLDVRDAGRGFDAVRYAQKANANLAVLRVLRAQGVVVDAVSSGEIERALAAGFAPREIQFCADLLDDSALTALSTHACEVNAGSADMLPALAPIARDRGVTLRINPGFGHGHDARVSTGGELSKHGIWHEELDTVARDARRLGLAIKGLHVHIGSGSDVDNLLAPRAVLARWSRAFADTLETLSCGGGLPIPYRDTDPRADVARLFAGWNELRRELERELGRSLRLEVEPGRFLVAEAGLLLARVRGTKRSGERDYVLIDAGFDNLLRPAMYGAFHQLSVVGKDHAARAPRIVAGPLCESGDVFTQGPGGRIAPQELPACERGDLICIHDAGAYAASMASNYNSRLLAAEVMVQNGAPRLVRARQTMSDLLRNERP